MNLNQGLVNTSGVDFINFLRPIRALRPTFEKLFIGVRRALRRALSFDRAISMICAVRPTFKKSTPYHICFYEKNRLTKNGRARST